MSVTIILLAMSIVCGLALFYPYLIYPVLLKLFSSKSIERSLDHQPSISLLFCSYNEERSLPAKIDNLLSLKARYANLNIFAFDDGSTDSSAKILSSRPDLLTLIQGSGRGGKAHGMKLLAAAATGEILLFTDANVILDINSVLNIRSYFADSTVGGVCGTLRYQAAVRSGTAIAGSLYWRLEEYLKSEESRSGNVLGADGSIFSVRRELYPDFPDTVLDDLTVSMNVIFAGYRLVRAADAIAYEQLITKRGDEFRRKVRIAARSFHTHQYLRNELHRMHWKDQFKYSSRKYIRWFGGLFLLTSLLLFEAALLTIDARYAFVSMGFMLAAGLFVARAPTASLSSVADIVLAMMANLIGIWRAVRGQIVTTWTPSKSR